MEVIGFNWDDGNRVKCQLHGVSVAEIESLFRNKPSPNVVDDSQHSIDEHRFRAFGMTTQGRYLFVVFTIRPNGKNVLIRPISARYMHQKEVETYEKEIPDFQ